MTSSDNSALFGLVLAGGESQRMGRSKAFLQLENQPLWLRAYKLLLPFCSQVFISCRPDQRDLFPKAHSLIIDQFPDTGPMGALRSAWKNHQTNNWLVVPCDLPLLTSASLQKLVERRNSEMMATAFQNPEDEKPEPLAAIWEANGLKQLDAEAKNGRRSPRKVLMAHPHQMVSALSPNALMNTNTPEQWEAILAKVAH